MASSAGWKMVRVTWATLVKMYLALAASLPPWRRVPNWPFGSSMLRLLLPTKSCARPMMVPWSDTSPWWYAECSET